MCWLCPSKPGVSSRAPAPPLLSRRRFQQGLFAAGMMQPVGSACFPATADDVVEAEMRLEVGPDAPRTVALTLDACSGGFDHRIIDALIAHAIPATIFATEIWLHANAEATALLRDHSALFTLQNHGERHLPPITGARHIYGLPVAGDLGAVHREVTRGGDAVAEAVGQRPHWYRGAAGLYSPPAIPVIQAAGYSVAGYSLNADAGASLPAPSVARRLAAARSGDVIVAHVNQPHRQSGAGVALGVTGLHETGTLFVPLDALKTTSLTCHAFSIGRRGLHEEPVT